MSAISLRLPDSLHNKVKELAKREGISINQLITLALAEKISALETADFLLDQKDEQLDLNRLLLKISGQKPDKIDI